MATIKSKKNLKAITGAIALARQAKSFPASRMVLDFDEEADVVYISFQHPQKATDTVELEWEDKELLLRFREKKLIGITVLEATDRYANQEVSPNGRKPSGSRGKK